MPDQEILREKARNAVLSGKLPSRSPDRMSNGSGGGAECPICELPVTTERMEFEVQFARDGDTPGLDTFYFHFRCFAAWEAERRLIERRLAEL